MAEPKRRQVRVCVVGAGAAGLCAARHLAANTNGCYEFTVFERSADVGGIWTYTDKVGQDDDGLPVHSSMYRDLRTNLPKEIMSFPDYPEIKGGDRSCVSHNVILEYLKNYANHFQLRQYIKFNTIIECIKLEKPENESSNEQWQVKVKNLKTSKSEDLTFDAVIVCNGHYFDPYVPEIPGLTDFGGQVMHSREYRKPENFAGKRVVLLGAASSGVDIAFELSSASACVYLSHNKDRLSADEGSLGFTEVAGIERFAAGKFVLRDRTLLAADVLIFCTGYNFSYPFLDKNCGIQVENNHVRPLHKHLINVLHPSMCLVGLPMIVVPFPLFHMQIQYFLWTLNRRDLGETLMEDSVPKERSNKRHVHRLADAQWSYNAELARAADIPGLPAYYEAGYKAWHVLRKAHPRDYKRFNLVVAADQRNVRIVDSTDGKTFVAPNANPSFQT